MNLKKKVVLLTAALTTTTSMALVSATNTTSIKVAAILAETQEVAKKEAINVGMLGGNEIIVIGLVALALWWWTKNK